MADLVSYLMVPLRPPGKKTPLLVELPPVTIWMICAGVRAKAMLFESASTKVVAGRLAEPLRLTFTVVRPMSSTGVPDGLASLLRVAEIF